MSPASGYDEGMLRVNVAAETLERVQRRIDASLSQLRADCDAATARWHGPAQAGYRVLQARWDAGAAELNATLGQIAAGVHDASGIYSTAEARNTGRWEI